MQQQTWTLPEGLAFSDIARPGSPQDVADLLRDATANNLPVVPVGGGTSLTTGHVVDHEFLGIDLRGLSGVREYAPADLTASFQAGTSLDEVRNVLGEHGQELPVDMPRSSEATIGGLVATGFSGPRRLGSGSLKDLLIGCAYVRGDGLIAKAGGMLVKNVSGYEMTRLMHGSWGALAILTSVNLKVIPKAKADFTFHQRYDGLEEALSAQRIILERHPLVTASVIERDLDGWGLAVRLLGREASLRAQVQSMQDDLGAGSSLAEDAGFWLEFNDRWAMSDDGARLVFGMRPHQVPAVASALNVVNGVSAMAISVPTGSIRLALDSQAVSLNDIVTRLGEIPESQGVSWVVEAAPGSWKQGGPVWGPNDPARTVMRSIKQQFDPAGVLNRGRLVV